MSGSRRPFQGIVGIDVSKDKFDACGIREDGAKLFQFSATMDRNGFEKLKSHLSSVPMSSVLIGAFETQIYGKHASQGSRAENDCGCIFDLW